jgi:hypothetical protein
VIRALVLVALLAPAAALAQQGGPAPMAPGAPMTMHGPMMHAPMADGSMTPASPGAPAEAGQSAFAAIQEIVAILKADPHTEWAKVDIDALRQHLVDMNAVMLEARVASAPVDGGSRFDVTGDGAVQDSIRRMVMAHAATMNGVDGWKFEAAPIAGGASLTVHAPPKDAAKLKGLGFFGVLTLGMHHQMHHLMIARGR